MANKKAPKYPRVWITAERHQQLAAEAKKQGKTIGEVAEESFKKTFKK